MKTTTVHIDVQTRQKLRDLAAELKLPMRRVLAEAIESYGRDRFFQAADASYAALRANPVRWAVELDERRLWDATLLDGL